MIIFSSLNSIDEDDESFDYDDGEVFERKSPSLVQFTRSISAINSMSLGVQVLKAKKAFLKALAVRHLTAEDYRKQGEARWIEISSDYQPTSLIVADFDFSYLSEKIMKPQVGPQESSAHSTNLSPTPPPPPPPPPPPVRSPSSPAPPTPPPPPARTPSSAPPTPQFSEQRLIPFHWSPIHRTPPANSVWSNLPQVRFDKQQLSQLFKARDSPGKKSSVSSQRKDKVLTVLDPKRSNQINIALTSLPPVCSLRDIILDMKDDMVTRDDIEKLQALLPSEDEVSNIRQSHQACPDLPLGSAEQFLLTLSSISSLDGRLKLWLFKLDFKIMTREICEPYSHLLSGITEIKQSQTLQSVLAVTLALGNEMNRTNVSCFDLASLLKLASIKDSSSRKSLLHFLVKSLSDSPEQLESLSQQFHHFSLISKTDFEELAANLVHMEGQCKNSLGYLRLAATYDRTTKSLVEGFLEEAVKEMVGLRVVMDVATDLFLELLTWLGIPASRHSDYTPARLASILNKFSREFDEARQQLEIEAEKEGRERRMRMRRVKSMIDVDYRPRKEMFSRQSSLSNYDNGGEDRGQLAEADQQKRTDDLESVLNTATRQSNPALRKYIKRRKSLTSSIKL